MSNLTVYLHVFIHNPFDTITGHLTQNMSNIIFLVMLNINIDLENIIIIILLLSEQSTFQLTLDNITTSQLCR